MAATAVYLNCNRAVYLNFKYGGIFIDGGKFKDGGNYKMEVF
jgi:hypothetical protein